MFDCSPWAVVPVVDRMFGWWLGFWLVVGIALLGEQVGTGHDEC